LKLEDGKITRKSITPIAVYVLPEEKILITKNAQEHSMSVAQFLRELGLGNKPTSTLDVDLILNLCKVNGDLGRLGGLLKIWLSDRDIERRFSVNKQIEVSELLSEINATRIKLDNYIGRLN